MRDYLEDIVRYTVGVAQFERLLYEVNDGTVSISAALNKDLVAIGEYDAATDIRETCGFPNLSKLKILLSIPEYAKENEPSITIYNEERADGIAQGGIQFTNKDGTFKNKYRFMDPRYVKMANLKNEIDWTAKATVSEKAVSRLAYQAQVHLEDVKFMPKVDDGKLVFEFGSENENFGRFIFSDKVEGNLSGSTMFPISHTLATLSLPGEKSLTLRNGIIGVHVQSPMGKYTYYILGATN